MPKSRSLTDVDKVYMEATLDHEAEDVAEKLGLSLKQVKGYRVFFLQQQDIKEKADNSHYHLYDTKTAGGNGGVTGMTQAASMSNSVEDRYTFKINKLKDEINKAIANGEIDKAHKLQQEIDGYQSARDARMKADDSSYILTRPR